MNSGPKQPQLSFEVYPPSTPADAAALDALLAQLRVIGPSFVSVTYSNHALDYDQATIGLARTVQAQVHCPVMVHLLAAYTSQAQVGPLLDELATLGITRILGLRGDLENGQARFHDFRHASDLIRFIKTTHPQFSLAGAGYPAGHPESLSRQAELVHLKSKVDAGCDQLMTQVFYDNRQFDRFRTDCAALGINIPIIAGIMPITSQPQATRLATAGIQVPDRIQTWLTRYQADPVALRAAGIADAVAQIAELVAHGVAGIHLYTLNQEETAREIYAQTATLFGR